MFSTTAKSFAYGRRFFTVSNPNLLPNLQVWYDAAISNTTSFNIAPANGDDISQWKDKSAVGHNANQSGNASVKPNWYSNVQNGLGAVRFNGTSESLNINPTAWLTNGGLGFPGFSLFVVARATSLTGVRPITCTDTDGMKIFHDGTHWGMKIAGGTGMTAVAGDTTNFHLFSMIYDGTGATNSDRLKFRYDQTELPLTFTGTVGTATSGTTNYFYLGQNTTSNFFQGEIGEVIMFTRKLPSAEIGGVESYLNNRWNVT